MQETKDNYALRGTTLFHEFTIHTLMGYGSYPFRVTADSVCAYFLKDFRQMLQGEFYRYLPLLLTSQQLSVGPFPVYYSFSLHFSYVMYFNRLTRYCPFVNRFMCLN